MIFMTNQTINTPIIAKTILTAVPAGEPAFAPGTIEYEISRIVESTEPITSIIVEKKKKITNKITSKIRITFKAFDLGFGSSATFYPLLSR